MPRHVSISDLSWDRVGNIFLSIVDLTEEGDSAFNPAINEDTGQSMPHFEGPCRVEYSRTPDTGEINAYKRDLLDPDTDGVSKHDRARKEKDERNQLYALRYKQRVCTRCGHRSARRARCAVCGGDMKTTR